MYGPRNKNKNTKFETGDDIRIEQFLRIIKFTYDVIVARFQHKNNCDSFPEYVGTPNLRHTSRTIKVSP